MVDVVDDCVLDFDFNVAFDETLVNLVVVDIFSFVVLKFVGEVNFDKTVDVDIVTFSDCVDEFADFVVDATADVDITRLGFEVCDDSDDLALVVNIEVGCVKLCAGFDIEDNFVGTLVDVFLDCVLNLGLTLVDCVDKTVFVVDVGVFCEELDFDGLLVGGVEDGV